MSADVDLVMMSKATTDELAAMTQRAIDTAIRGTTHKLNVVVMEQGYVTYADATTVAMGSDRFNYNAFANRGAKMGQAPWICVANNDLTFMQGWLEALLAVNHPVVSPLSPTYHRHFNVWRNETGWQVGRHFAGWCFMMARWVWEDIGGLDESREFWCSDNVVVDQLRAKALQGDRLVRPMLQPMVVRDAVVHHNVSSTLSMETPERQAELTWGELHQYNADSDTPALTLDPRYLAWKRGKGIR